MDVILASSSPQRIKLLKDAGITFKQVIPCVSEIQHGKDPYVLAVKNARLKAETVSEDYLDAVVIGADTIVLAKDGDIIGKPYSQEEAFEILSKLSGTTQEVITGVAVVCKAKNIQETFYEMTKVTMRNITEEEITEYIKTGEPFGKAGAFAIQENGDEFIEKIEGDFTNVVGLPVQRVLEVIQKIKDF